MTKDPVCGMRIDEAKAGGKTVHKGKTYCFCSLSCKVAFDKEPDKYADKTEAGSKNHQH